MVSAFAARQRLVLGQVKVADKSNEIEPSPKLLAIEGAIVTIDAMGCQSRRRPRRAGWAREQTARGFADTEISQDTTVDGDHGRIG